MKPDELEKIAKDIVEKRKLVGEHGVLEKPYYFYPTHLIKDIEEALKTLRSKTRKEDTEKLRIATEALKTLSEDLLISGDARKLSEGLIPNALKDIDGLQKLAYQALQTILKKEEEEHG